MGFNFDSMNGYNFCCYNCITSTHTSKSIVKSVSAWNEFMKEILEEQHALREKIS